MNPDERIRVAITPADIHDPACIHSAIYVAEIVPLLYPTYESLCN